MAVSCDSYSVEAASRIARLHNLSGLASDVFFVSRKQLGANILPTPVDFVVKPDGALFRSQTGSMDFLINRQDAHECGSALFGPPTKDLVPEVPWALLREALLWLLPHIADRFKNPVLMLCRVAYAIHHRSLCSKVAAGEWARKHLGIEWADLIDEALQEYTAGVAQVSQKHDITRSFSQYCENYVRRLEPEAT